MYRYTNISAAAVWIDESSGLPAEAGDDAVGRCTADFAARARNNAALLSSQSRAEQSRTEPRTCTAAGTLVLLSLEFANLRRLEIRGGGGGRGVFMYCKANRVAIGV